MIDRWNRNTISRLAVEHIRRWKIFVTVSRRLLGTGLMRSRKEIAST